MADDTKCPHNWAHGQSSCPDCIRKLYSDEMANRDEANEMRIDKLASDLATAREKARTAEAIRLTVCGQIDAALRYAACFKKQVAEYRSALGQLRFVVDSRRAQVIEELLAKQAPPIQEAETGGGESARQECARLRDLLVLALEKARTAENRADDEHHEVLVRGNDLCTMREQLAARDAEIELIRGELRVLLEFAQKCQDIVCSVIEGSTVAEAEKHLMTYVLDWPHAKEGVVRIAIATPPTPTQGRSGREEAKLDKCLGDGPHDFKSRGDGKCRWCGQPDARGRRCNIIGCHASAVRYVGNCPYCEAHAIKQDIAAAQPESAPVTSVAEGLLHVLDFASRKPEPAPGADAKAEGEWAPCGSWLRAGSVCPCSTCQAVRKASPPPDAKAAPGATLACPDCGHPRAGHFASDGSCQFCHRRCPSIAINHVSPPPNAKAAPELLPFGAYVRTDIHARALNRAEALEKALRELVESLPTCDKCGQPATRSRARGAFRWCDDHPESTTAPDYPRAGPLRNALALLDPARRTEVGR